MPRAIFVTLLVAASAAPGLAAQQTDYYARLGAIWSSTLLEDRVVNTIETQQSIAPMLVVGAGLPLAPRYNIGIEAALTTGGYHATENGVDADLGTLRTLSGLILLDGPIAPQLRWRAGVGGLVYLPADETGIFAQGGTTRLLAAAGIDWRRPALRGWDLMTSARYDYHTFSTDQLLDRGFTQPHGVSRVSLSIGLARAAR